MLDNVLRVRYLRDMKYTANDIKEMLKDSDKAVLRGLIRIYSLQTASEQSVGDTMNLNGVGFSGADAKFLSSVAQQYIQRGTLTKKQIAFTRKNMMRYASQLAKVANGQIECPPLPTVRGQGNRRMPIPVPTTEPVMPPIMVPAKPKYLGPTSLPVDPAVTPDKPKMKQLFW